MALNYDCCLLISRYLSNSDYLNFCTAFNIEPDTSNLTRQFIEENIMELYELNIDLEKVIDDLDWYTISIYRKLSEGFLRKFKHYVNWKNVCTFQQLSEEFIKQFESYVDWSIISRNQKISVEFVREFKDHVNWRTISQSRELSEDFIREFQDYVDWSSISSCQHLSDRFQAEFEDRIDWERISRNERNYRKCEENINWCLGSFVYVLFLSIVISWYVMNNNSFSSSSFLLSVCILIIGMVIASVGPPDYHSQ